MPGEDPLDLPPPEAIAEALLPLLDPALTVTGAIFDFRGGAFHQRFDDAGAEQRALEMLFIP